jgi:hypothetical protein
VSISDERLNEMLAGLEGVTPGPWEFDGNSITDWGREWEASMSMEWVANGTGEEGMNERRDFDGAHIASCDPDTIRAIVTELQSFRAAAKVANSEGDGEAWNEFTEAHRRHFPYPDGTEIEVTGRDTHYGSDFSKVMRVRSPQWKGYAPYISFWRIPIASIPATGGEKA